MLSQIKVINKPVIVQEICYMLQQARAKLVYFFRLLFVCNSIKYISSKKQLMMTSSMTGKQHTNTHGCAKDLYLLFVIIYDELIPVYTFLNSIK